MSEPDRPVLFDTLDPSDAGHERFRATDHARGPWNREHCHGGPPSALLARACERFVDTGSDPSVDWQLTRITIELMRPVPVTHPLEVVVTAERSGRKISLVSARLRDVEADEEVAVARALRIRRADVALPPHPRLDDEIDGEPGDGELVRPDWSLDDGGTAFHRSANEHRFTSGSWNEGGPCRVWIRLLADIVADESPTGTQRAVAAADFGNGVSGALPAEEITYINPDLTVHLARAPEGEWIGLASHSVYGTATESTGAGYAESALHDRRGRLGRSVQSLIIQPT